MIAQVNPDLYRPDEKLRFSTTPLKWIRYCIGAVTGALPRGNLSRKAESLEVIDYDQPLTESIALYHYVSDAEKQYMFPTDPHLADPPKTNSVHSRASTTTLASVASAKICRNGMFVAWRVVWTRCSEMQYTSCPIAKMMTKTYTLALCRPQYIKALTSRRCRGHKDEIVPAIDDIRNGILLQAGFHKLLRQTLAFMPIPNFAMDANDVLPPGADPSENICIIHLFEPLKSFDIAGARLAMSDSGSWPPPALFDAAYDALVLREFGVPVARARVADVWEDLYYPRGGFDAATAEMDVRRRRARAHWQRAEARGPAKPDHFDLLMMVPYTAVPPDELQKHFADVERKAEQEERRGVEEKVNIWREGVAR